MSIKAKLEAIIYATEEPVTLKQLASLLRESVLSEMRAEEEARLALNETVSDLQAGSAEDEDELPGEVLSSGDDLTAPPGAETLEAMPGDQLSSADAQKVDSASVTEDQKDARDKQELNEVKARIGEMVDQLIAEYSASDRGMEIRQIAGGYRMTTKPEHHDVVVNFAKSLKPPVRLSLQALETLAVIAYKQPVTVPEISEIRGVDSAGVIATLLDRKLVTTAGRKQVIGRPILYKTTKEFLLRFGLRDVSELPSVEEFEKLGDPQTELFQAPAATAPASEASGNEEESPVSEAAPELVKEGNRESHTTVGAEAETPEAALDPVTEGDPHLVSEENREPAHAKSAPGEVLDRGEDKQS